jgi:lipopolysaccharide transport system permease protein
LSASDAIQTIDPGSTFVPTPAPPQGTRNRVQRKTVSGLGDQLREFWFYRELFFFFVWRDIKVRYKQTALGAVWAVLVPFMTMIVFTLLFGKLAKLPHDGIPYPVFYYSGLLPWTYFASSLSNGSTSLVSKTNLITKVYFPRMLVPASAVLTGLLDFVVASALLCVIMIYNEMAFSSAMLLWPILIAPLVFLSLGISLFLSALNVRYRDVKHTIPFVVQIGMYASPVVYPTSMIPEKYQILMLFHPVAGVIEAFRSVVASRPINWLSYSTSVAVTIVIFVVGFTYFRLQERSFADVI